MDHLLCAETTTSSSSSSSSSSLAAPSATEQAYALRWPLRPPPPPPPPPTPPVAAASFPVSSNTNKNTTNCSNLLHPITDTTTTTTTMPADIFAPLKPPETLPSPPAHAHAHAHRHLLLNTQKPPVDPPIPPVYAASSSSSSSSTDHEYPRFGSNPYNRIVDLASTHGLMAAATPTSHPFGGVAGTPYPPPSPHGFSSTNGRRFAPPPPPAFEADEDRVFQYHPPASFGRRVHDFPAYHYEQLFGMPPTDSASDQHHHSRLLHSVLPPPPPPPPVSNNPPSLLRHDNFSAVPDVRTPVSASKAFDQDHFCDVGADPLLRSVGKSQSMRALYEENAALRRALYSMRAATARGMDPLAEVVVTNASSSSSLSSTSGISDHRCILSDTSEGRTLSMRERGRWAAIPEELLIGGRYGDPQHSSVWSGGHGRHPNYYQLSPSPSCLHHRAQYVSQGARHHPAPYGWNVPKGSGASRSGGYNYQPRSGGGGAIWSSVVVEEEEEEEVAEQRYGDSVRESQVQPTSLQQLIKQSCRSPVRNEQRQRQRQNVKEWRDSASPGRHGSTGKPKKAMGGGGGAGHHHHHHHHHHRRSSSSSYNKSSVPEEESECAMCGGKLQMMEAPSRNSLLILPHPSGRKAAGLPLRLCPACHPAAATVSTSSFIATSPPPSSPPPPPPLSAAAAHHRLVTAISMACKPAAAADNAPPNAKKKPKARILDICRHLVGLSHSK